jgi:hypothetical protein
MGWTIFDDLLSPRKPESMRPSEKIQEKFILKSSIKSQKVFEDS